MDVTCQRCKAEYEFDETLLGEKGTTVKCSTCGHVFRVLPPDRDAGRSPLRLRLARDGSVHPLESLRELQLRIRAGEVGLDDELGRDGHPFRRLRDLPELKNFFGRAPERTTVRPDAASSGLGPQGAPGGRGQTLFGNAPTVRPPPPAAPGGSDAFGDLEAPTVVAAVPDEVRPRSKRPAHGEAAPPNEPLPRAAKGDAKRTMIGVGVAGLAPGGLPPVKTPSSAGTLGPPAAAIARDGARDSGTPPTSRGMGHDATRDPHKLSAAGTLIGAPAAAFASQQLQPPAGLGRAPHDAHLPTELGIPAAPPPAPYEAPPAAPPPAYDAPPAAPRFAPDLRADRGAASLPPAGLTAPAKSLPSPRSNAPRPVKLYLEEDDVPMGRVSQSSSKFWIYPLLFAALAGAGWYGVNALRARRAAEAVTPEPSTASDAAVAEASPDAGALEAAADASLASATADAAPEPEPSAAEPAAPAAPEKEKEAPARSDAKSRSRSEESARERSSSRESAEPKDYPEWVARGDQLSAKGDNEGAAKAYESALKLRPSGSEANAGLGFALLARGRAREALKHFDSAANSGYAEANVGLGDAYRKLGQTSAALEAYETYLERLPTGGRAAYVRGMIDKLGRASGGGAGESPREPVAPPANDTGYRPAGELVEPPPAPEAPPANDAPASETNL